MKEFSFEAGEDFAMSKLKEILKQKDMTQVELSRRTGFNKDYINRFIKGHHDITLSKAKKIADVLDIKIDDLI